MCTWTDWSYCKLFSREKWVYFKYWSNHTTLFTHFRFVYLIDSTIMTIYHCFSLYVFITFHIYNSKKCNFLFFIFINCMIAALIANTWHWTPEYIDHLKRNVFNQFNQFVYQHPTKHLLTDFNISHYFLAELMLRNYSNSGVKYHELMVASSRPTLCDTMEEVHYHPPPQHQWV